MIDKEQIWVKRLALGIDSQYAAEMAGEITIIGDRIDAVISLINKHRPPDTVGERVEEGLAEALLEISNFPGHYGGILTIEAGKSAVMAMAQIAHAAIADYEEEKGESHE